MVAITTQPTAIALPRNDRAARAPRSQRPGIGRADLRLVPAHRGPSASALSRSIASRPLSAALVAVAMVAAIVAALLLAVAEPLPVAGDAPVIQGTHVATGGETMWSIARDVAPTGEAAIYVERLVDANGTASVAAGQVIQLPIP